jgi:tetraprenyl-beta-curcumene synthase
LREVSGEVDRWRTFAGDIPDDALRHDALAAIKDKRANIDGAALFWTLPRVRSRELLRLLVAYEILADFLDCTSERAAHAGTANGRQLHRALIEALDPDLEVSDYYRYHPWARDGDTSARWSRRVVRYVCDSPPMRQPDRFCIAPRA